MKAAVSTNAGYYFGDGTWNDGTYPSNCYYLCEWPRIITPVDPAPTITPIPTASPNPTTKPTAAPTVNPSSAPTEDERYRKVRSLAYDWVSEYNNYLSSLKNGLTKIASNNIKKHDLDSAAKSLEKQYGTLITATANLTEQQRHYIYKAVLELLAKTANDRLDLSSLESDKLESLPVKIVNEVARGIQNQTYAYQDGNKEVLISLGSYWGANFGYATYKEYGKPVGTAVIISTQETMKEIIADYVADLLELEKDLLIQSAKEAYKDLSNSLFSRTAPK